MAHDRAKLRAHLKLADKALAQLEAEQRTISKHRRHSAADQAAHLSRLYEIICPLTQSMKRLGVLPK